MDVTIIRCQCGHPTCKTYGVSNGTFYQGCGWEKEQAEFVAWAFNHPIVQFLYKLSKTFEQSKKEVKH